MRISEPPRFTMLANIEVFLVGHVCLDHVIINNRQLPLRIGGSPIYTGRALDKLQVPLRIISRVGRDIPPKLQLTLPLACLANQSPSHSQTTSYELTYSSPDHRELRLLQKGPNIKRGDLPPPPYDNQLFIIAPIAGEVSLELLEYLSTNGAILVIDMQGFIRQFSSNGHVTFKKTLTFPSLCPERTILKGSEKEVQYIARSTDPLLMAKSLADLGAHTVIITQEHKGCCLYSPPNKIWKIPAYPTPKTVDSTGAGDTFTAGFIAGLIATHDLIEAAKYGNATASFVLETLGPTGFPTHKQVLSRALFLKEQQVTVS